MKYELMLIVSSKLTDKEVEKNLKEIKEILREKEFELVDEDLWGVRDLAYKVAGHQKGYYVVLNFTGEAKGVPELHKELRIQAGILRYMLLKVPEDYVLLHYEQLLASAKAVKLSTPAEELTKKVREKRAEKPAEEAPQISPSKLDETLQAIIEDKDIKL